MFNMIYKAFVGNEEASLEVSDDIKRIIAFVPVYKESSTQICNTIDSILANNTGIHNITTCVVSDGVNDYTEGIFDTKLTTVTHFYKSWKCENVAVSVTLGKRNNKNVILISKDQNMGKKDSLILCNDLFNFPRQNMNVLTGIFKKDLLNLLSEHFGYNEYDYIFTTDADTTLDNNVLASLMDSIQKRNAVASCGVVNGKSSSFSLFWGPLQDFQYLYGQFLRRSNEDLFNQVLCLPGCLSMFKINEQAAEALNTYATLPDGKSLTSSCVQFVGTDRRYTSCLVYTNPEAKIVLDTRCNGYTIPPSDFGTFVKQRKRWTQNMYFNGLLNIISPNVCMVSRLFNVIDYLRLSLVYFRLFNTMYFVYLLAAFYNSTEILRLVPYIVLLVYPAFCFFVYALFNSHLRKNYFLHLFSLLINKIFIFVSTPVVFTSMLLNIGNAAW
jgi:chitin synthase